MKKYLLMLTVLLGSALMMQGFQCASKDISSAKNSFNLKDYDKAMTFLNSEISKNPTSGEAFLLQAKVYMEQNRYTEAAEALVKAEKHIKDPKLIVDKVSTIRKFMSDLYTDASGKIDKGTRFKKSAYMLDSALVEINAGLIVRPQEFPLHSLAAQAYEVKKDLDKALESYNKYLEVLQPEMKLAKTYNLTLKMPRTKLVDAFGKPTFSQGYHHDTFDTVITDKYIIDSKEAFFVIMKEKGELVVIGWRYDLPSTWTESEKITWRPLSTEAYSGMAAIYYGKNDYQNALESIKGIVALDPTNAEAYSQMIQLYQQLKKTDEAIALLNDRISKDPNNQLFLSQYGDLYLIDGDYDKAIEQYNKALKIDPKYDFVLRNIASAYKNKAAKIQSAEQEKQIADSKYAIDKTKYMPFIEQSTKYFELAFATERFKEDFDVMAELASLYMVANQKDKLTNLLTQLESMESTLDVEKKEAYYMKMANIYGAVGNEEKRLEMTKKFDEMSK